MLVQLNVSAVTLSNYRGGGTVKKLYLPSNAEELAEVLLKSRNAQPFILGGGSNTLFVDGVIKRPVVSTAALNNVWLEDGFILVGAGAKINDVIAFGRKHGLGGLEFLAGVPCTLGGAVRMNAGAFDAKTSDYVTEITVLSDDCDKIEVIDAREIEWGYRQGPTNIVLGARLKLIELGREESVNRARAYAKVRAQKQSRLPSLGSVFKNSDKPAGLYIEQADLKGMTCGRAQISPMHANFIVNLGGGTASDYLNLVRLSEEVVQEKFGIKLEREFVTVKD